jgi:hypothetical protein
MCDHSQQDPLRPPHSAQLVDDEQNLHACLRLRLGCLLRLQVAAIDRESHRSLVCKKLHGVNQTKDRLKPLNINNL